MHRSLGHDTATWGGLLLMTVGVRRLVGWWRDRHGARRAAAFEVTGGRLRADRRRAASAVLAHRFLGAGGTLSPLGLCVDYEVAGRPYIGRRFGYGGHVLRGDEETAVELQAKARRGEPVAVWYDPADPRESVLVRERVGHPVRELVVGLLLLAVGATLFTHFCITMERSGSR